MIVSIDFRSIFMDYLGVLIDPFHGAFTYFAQNPACDTLDPTDNTADADP
jgi:hypothetical protein